MGQPIKTLDAYTKHPAPRSNITKGMYWLTPDGTWVLYGGARGQARGFHVYGNLRQLESSDQYDYLNRTGAGTGTINLNEDAAQAKVDAKSLDKLLVIGPLKGDVPGLDNKTARYPEDALISKASDYVYFQFGKYVPPFSRDSQKSTNNATKIRSYSQASYAASTDLKIEAIKNPATGNITTGIVLPMPQDLGNDIQQTWNGKQFSALGRAAIAGTAGGNFAEIGTKISDIDGNLKAAITSLNTQLLNKIPGVGGNLDVGDITGSTEGIVLNPNAEILYDSPELREIGMTFKMIPRSATEAKIIKNIVYMFRYASVPQWGGNEGQTLSDQLINDGEGGTFEAFGKQNFMRVPFLCKFTFMNGNAVNDKVQQFKPCAIRKVAVNYTSDGTYATYRGGEPVATELTLNFLESKVLFKRDIQAGF